MMPSSKEMYSIFVWYCYIQFVISKLELNGVPAESANAWWHHQMVTFSASLAICAGNSPVTGEFPAKRLVTRSFDIFFDLHLNKQLSKQSWDWWFETPSRPLCRHRNGIQFSWFNNWSTYELKCKYSENFKQISRSLGVMNRLTRYFPQSILIALYNSLILHPVQ